MNQTIRIVLFAGLILAPFGLVPKAYAEHCTTFVSDGGVYTDVPAGVDVTTDPNHPVDDLSRTVTCGLFVAPIIVDARSGPSCDELLLLEEVDTLSSPVIELKINGDLSGIFSDPPDHLPTIDLATAKNSSGDPDAVVVRWTDITPEEDGAPFEMPGQELVYLRAGNLANVYRFRDATEDFGLTGPVNPDGTLPTINVIKFCASGALCPLSQDYLNKELGPTLNPGLKFPVQLPNNFCNSNQAEVPACCTSGPGGTDECTAIDHPDFVVQYVIGNHIGASTNFVCGLPPLVATRAAEISGDAFFSLAGTAIVTTKVNPPRDTSTRTTNTTTTTDTSSGGTNSETEYSIGCPFDNPEKCR